mmetsp:Transcript_10459/g.19250  ORF Transcript_10459/g.19250 Transcript_10459/m.19250 type:complete len:277 (-) Transcript_10459:192-1022(-)
MFRQIVCRVSLPLACLAVIVHGWRVQDSHTRATQGQRSNEQGSVGNLKPLAVLLRAFDPTVAFHAHSPTAHFPRPRPVPKHRASHPQASTVTFNAKRTITSEPFEATEMGLREWFGKAESIQALCSMADNFREIPPNRVEVTTRIPFPGIIAKSVSVMEVAKDLEAPSFDMKSAGSKTVCETGPQWVRDLFVRILDVTKTTSDNAVRVTFSGSTARVQSDVTLKVEIEYPGFIPMPVGPMEREGSKSLQGVLDQQMAPVIAKFRSDYLAFEASREK